MKTLSGRETILGLTIHEKGRQVEMKAPRGEKLRASAWQAVTLAQTFHFFRETLMRRRTATVDGWDEFAIGFLGCGPQPRPALVWRNYRRDGRSRNS